MERKMNQVYFTILGTIVVTKDIDLFTDYDTIRYNAGNYFLKREDAELMAKSIRTLLKTFHKNKK